MDLIVLVLTIALFGFLIWLITTKIPMPPAWAMAIQVVALVVVLFWLIRLFGGLPNVLPAPR